MGSYNTTYVNAECPRCNIISEMEVDLYFGETARFLKLKIGDTYPFYEKRQPQNGGPVDEGDGYAECPKCNKDFFLIAKVENGILTNVIPDNHTLPYISDEDIEDKIECVKCNSNETRKRMYFGKYNKSTFECYNCKYKNESDI